jgi:hypothetical protein
MLLQQEASKRQTRKGGWRNKWFLHTVSTSADSGRSAGPGYAYSDSIWPTKEIAEEKAIEIMRYNSRFPEIRRPEYLGAEFVPGVDE